MICDYVWGKKVALVIVDPQRKFSLNVPDWESRMGSAVKGINEFAKLFREHGCPVILIRFIGESHTGYQGDDADEWLPGLEVKDSDIIVDKQHMNCFKDTNLLDILKENGVDSAIYAGMLTEFCVISTYFGSGERSVFPYLAKGALIPYNEKGNDAAELICSMVEVPTVKRFLDGDQPPIQPMHH